MQLLQVRLAFAAAPLIYAQATQASLFHSIPLVSSKSLSLPLQRVCSYFSKSSLCSMAGSTLNGDLTTWAQSRIAALYEATEEDNFHTAFDSLFSQSVEIGINHESVGRDAAKHDFMAKRFAAKNATVKWENVMSVPNEDDDQTGIVAGVFTITRTMKLRIRAAPAQRNAQCVFSAKIERDTSIAQDDAAGDNRRITQLWQTMLDKAAPIHLTRPHGTGAEEPT